MCIAAPAAIVSTATGIADQTMGYQSGLERSGLGTACPQCCS